MARTLWSTLPLLVLLSVTPAARAAAQGGDHAAVFLELPTSARLLGLGGAGSAVPDGAMSLFSNPAQLAAERRASVAGSGQRYLASSTLAAVAGSNTLGPGIAALGIQTLRYGDAPEIVPDPAFGGERGTPTGASVSASDLAVSTGYAMMRGPVSVGAAAKYVLQQIAGVSGSTVAADIGLTVALRYGLIAGIAAQHLGGGIAMLSTRGSLPATLRAGLSAPVAIDATRGVLLGAEVVQVDGAMPEVRGGAEGVWRISQSRTLAVRAGVTSRFDRTDASPLTAGASVAAGRFAVDYAFQSFASFGGMHRVGIRWLGQ